MRFISVAALVLLSLTPARAQEWVEFVSRDDGFKVNFPAQPNVTGTTYTSEYGAMLPARVYEVMREQERYSVTVVDYRGIEKILTAKAKPFIVSMGTSAASGGYYAAVAGGPIFANRATITGSIGIFYGKVDVVGLLGKLGVGVEQFRTAPRADAESFYRPFTDEERFDREVVVQRRHHRSHFRDLAAQPLAVARGAVVTVDMHDDVE